jgi:AbrB family looped-hinge helix DNA binding protein
MRVTSKGQVTIPADVLEDAGILPNTEVEIACDGDGRIVLSRAGQFDGKTRGERVVEHLRRFAKEHPVSMTTEEIMALTRGED